MSVQPPCTCGFDPIEVETWSAEWHRQHKPHHVATYPDIVEDRMTMDNLDLFIEWAERLVNESTE